jgi:hypothetical protein
MAPPTFGAADRVVAFDLLFLNSYDLRELPLYQRKALLKKTMADADVQFTESFEVDGHEMYIPVCRYRSRTVAYPLNRHKALQARDSRIRQNNRWRGLSEIANPSSNEWRDQ